MVKNKALIYIFFICAILFSYCRNTEVPKPQGYFRIDFPEKKYIPYQSNMPYTFEYPIYGIIKPDTKKNAEPHWINIEFPDYKAKLHLSYKPIKNNLAYYIEDARKLAYKHTIKADAINEKIIKNKNNRVYGILYNIRGNTASSLQFFVTDSVNNFLRGSLYISSQPNKDSIQPVIEFFRADIEHIINTLCWK